MRPYYQDGDVTLFRGDCRDVLAQLPAESVSCCMTSPPFFGLRKYTCEPSIWGGDPNCPHSLEAQPVDGESYAGRKRWQHDGVSRQETPEAWMKEQESAPHQDFAGMEWETGGQPQVHSREPISRGATCSLCGAWRGWLGLEPTVEMYVAHTTEWLRAVRRVLRRDGCLWLDIDDSRASGGQHSGFAPQKAEHIPYEVNRQRAGGGGIAAKNLCLIPQRIAIAAQEDGWIVRSEIVITSWMPESAKDRPTDACRKVLMLVKDKRYWYDGQAVRIEAKTESLERYERTGDDGRILQSGPYKEGYDAGVGLQNPKVPVQASDGLRNLGSVWMDIGSAGYPDAHFATFAVKEPERCILASCPAEICVKCGKARRRVVKKGLTAHDGKTASDYPDGTTGKRLSLLRQAARERGGEYVDGAETVGWTDCGCGAGFQAGTVLDPFIGTGTTAIAARKLGRRCIGIDHSEEYLQQAVTRLSVGDSGIRRMVEARRAGAEQGVLW